MRRRALLLTPLLLASPAQAQDRSARTPPRTLAAPPPDQAALVAQAEAALAALPAFQARFQENSGPDAAAIATGRIWMDRGRMRVEYDPPSRQLMIASRGQVIHYDPALGSSTHLPASSTPLGPLLQDPPRLSDPSLLIQEVRRQPGILRVRVANARRPREGSVEILMEDRSAALALIGWNIRDAQGRQIAVRLADVRPLDFPNARLFTFLDTTIFGADANYQVPR